MKPLIAILGSLFLLLLSGFCLFGFLATFEATENQVQFIAFRIGYSVLGLSCLSGAAVLTVNAMRKREE